jgi:hypothetical protein
MVVPSSSKKPAEEKMRRTLIVGLTVALLSGTSAVSQQPAPDASVPEGGMAADAADFTVEFADEAWNGETIPEGQQCAEHGGAGVTPTLDVAGIPEGTTDIVVTFSDETNESMASGGHGVISYAVEAGETTMALPSVPAETEEGLPEGVSVAAPNKRDAGVGYLPPCSGGSGNMYSAEVTAIDHTGAELASASLQLGTY